MYSGTPEFTQRFPNFDIDAATWTSASIAEGCAAHARLYEASDVQAEAQQDPTEGGRNCDFCQWQSLTAEDTFGRWQNHLDSARSGLCCQHCYTARACELAA